MRNAKPMILGRFLRAPFDTKQLVFNFPAVSFGFARLMNINALPSPAANNADIPFLHRP
jgi:hypothetical protein